nr:MAG TPA: hypothetical protein [Caudoviricetes sp.]
MDMAFRIHCGTSTTNTQRIDKFFLTLGFFS